ncbi:hypothetical protein AYL99_09493 [Fonsecaea erecta]|uniref:HTH CENPB-type domain-containing protein n=1 Tax=Fonsecaea erecta TaxID=1367422 RepID=A0A178Z947_9EURO|nr:hypothetical protein AYL99_09493 [Fonsecaea erecta]OAP56314.1 hypothetical protein AYL99_09493 [Fonsecaea erecta]
MTPAGISSENRSSPEIPASFPLSRDPPRTTLPIGSNEIAPRRKKAVNQQYLTPQEEKALVAYILQCADNGFPLPVKALRRLALVIRQRRDSTRSTQTRGSRVQPPDKNYPQALYSRHPELRARRLKAIDWTRANENIHDKNVYNMDEAGVLLGYTTTVKMLVHSKDTRRHRGTGVKRVLITSIECVSAAGIALPPLIIWPASTHLYPGSKTCLIRKPVPAPPLDIGVFGPLKSAYREQVEQLYRGGAGIVGKQHFTFLYSRARQTALTESNIISAWSKVGLFPFDPTRVLATISGSQTDKNAPQIAATQTHLFSPDKIQATPVTSEDFAALRRLIEGESQQVSELSQHRLQEAFNAAERALTESSLLRDRSQELFLQNCEKKLRQSTRSTVIGTARVMSYRDIVVKRSTQETIKTTEPRSDAGRQGPSVSRHPSTVSSKAPRKRGRQGELEQAIQEIDRSEIGNYCHVFEL